MVGRIDGILDIIEIHRNKIDSVDDDIETQLSDFLTQRDAGHPFGCRVKHRIKAHIGSVENLISCSGMVLCSSADLIKVWVY